jgi:alpha-glucosidase
MKFIFRPFLLVSLILFVSCNSGQKYSSGIVSEDIAVFYPDGFDFKSHMPSFAIEKELDVIAEIPDSWELKPVFCQDSGKSVVKIAIPEGADLYGTGEVIGPLKRNGQKITLWNTDNYIYKKDGGKSLYHSHPWVLGVNKDGSSFGIICDNTWKQDLILDDSIRFVAQSSAPRVIIIKGENPAEVLKSMTLLTGRIELPPLWSLGFQQSRYSYEPDTRVRDIADEFRKRSLPCDVIWHDIDYMNGYRVFTFDSIKFPDPAALNKYLHEKKFKAVWMIDPGVKVDETYSVYQSGTAGNHWVKDSKGNDFIGKVWPGECKFPDFTRPETQKWWAALYKDYMAKGIDGVWNDMNEPSVFEVESGTMPEDNIHRGGKDLVEGPHLRYHNVYGMLMIRSSREGILAVNPEKRPFILSRSGFLGSHRYGATWTGDNSGTYEHMKLSVPMLLNLGMSGQVFSGPDIGGFDGNTSADLFAHWISIGVFYPFSRAHAAVGTNNKEPWAFGPEVENTSRISLNRRYRLLPYYYTLFQEASANGMPIMRPVFFADFKDTTLRKEQQAFMIGSDLIVLPKWAVNVSMPAGNWRTVSIAGENSQKDKYLPDVKIRQGAVVPLCNLVQSTVDYSTDSITLLVSLDETGKAYGKIYEDEGDGFGYKSGKYTLSDYNAYVEKDKLQLRKTVSSGKGNSSTKYHKIILYTDSGVIESKWQKGDLLTLSLK